MTFNIVLIFIVAMVQGFASYMLHKWSKRLKRESEAIDILRNQNAAIEREVYEKEIYKKQELVNQKLRQIIDNYKAHLSQEKQSYKDQLAINAKALTIAMGNNPNLIEILSKAPYEE